MAYTKNDGSPECPTGNLGPFTSNAVDRTNIKGSVAFEGDAKPNKALGEFGAVTRAKKNDSITAHGSASIPK